MNKLIKAEDEKKEKPFPKLMKYRLYDEAYVYFKQPGVGVVVRGERFFWAWYSTDAWDMGYFKDTDDKIILNEKD